jgi:hypothetical protein
LEPYVELKDRTESHSRNSFGLPHTDEAAAVPLPFDIGKRVTPVAEIRETLKNDQWNEKYVDDFIGYTEAFRENGISDLLRINLTPTSREKIFAAAKKKYAQRAECSVDELEEYWITKANAEAEQDYQGALQCNEGSYLMYDDNCPDDLPFGNLRQEGGATEKVTNYIRDQGGDPEIIRSWLASQGDVGSYSDQANAIKYFLAVQRGKATTDDFYWGEKNKKYQSSLESAKASYDTLTRRDANAAEVFEKTITMWHAFISELLINMDFPGKTDRGTVILKRNEPFALLDELKIEKSDKAQDVPRNFRAVTESFSLTRPPNVENNVLTETEVPLQRVLAVYFTSKPGEVRACALQSDGENEFVVMGDGLKILYRDPPVKKREEFIW